MIMELFYHKTAFGATYGLFPKTEIEIPQIEVIGFKTSYCQPLTPLLVAARNNFFLFRF